MVRRIDGAGAVISVVSGIVLAVATTALGRQIGVSESVLPVLVGVVVGGVVAIILGMRTKQGTRAASTPGGGRGQHPPLEEQMREPSGVDEGASEAREYSEREIAARVRTVETQRRSLEADLRRQSPVYETLVHEMQRVYGEQDHQAAGGLGQTERILIALAMAVYSGSESAIDWTMTRAFNHGANERKIRDAIEVALLNGGTFAVAGARFAHGLVDYRRKVRPPRS